MKTIFDKKTFLANFSGMEDLAVQGIESFIKCLPELVSKVEHAVRTRDAAQLELSAHTLKGAISNFHAEPARLLAWRLEQMGHGEITADAGIALNDLRVELEKLSTALRQLLKEMRA